MDLLTSVADAVESAVTTAVEVVGDAAKAVAKVIERVVKTGYEYVKAKVLAVMKFLVTTAKRICDVVFSQLQLEFSSEQDQAETRELIDEQRRKKAGHRRTMTCKCCNTRLIAHIFDCGHMACETCDVSNCAVRCFECDEIIRDRDALEYDRSALN